MSYRGGEFHNFFFSGAISGGSIINNTAIGKGVGGADSDGFRLANVANLSDVSITGNIANSNRSDGFQINFVAGNVALYSNNSATNNVVNQHNITGTPGAGILGSNPGTGAGAGVPNF